MIILKVYISFKFALEELFPTANVSRSPFFLCEVFFEQEGNFAFVKKATQLRNLPLYHNKNTFIHTYYY